MRGRLAFTMAALALAAPTAAGAQDAEPKTNLADISDEVMCTVCGVPLELAQEAPQAEAQRDFIRNLIAQGQTKDEIKDALVAEYGENVLAVPGDEGFDLFAWLVPIAAFVLAAGAVLFALTRWRRARAADESDGQPADVDSRGKEKLEADMARYDL